MREIPADMLFPPTAQYTLVNVCREYGARKVLGPSVANFEMCREREEELDHSFVGPGIARFHTAACSDPPVSGKAPRQRPTRERGKMLGRGAFCRCHRCGWRWAFDASFQPQLRCE